MTWPAALLPGAAVRVLRTAAGRRALQLALLVGGLVVLGLFCGEQAQAAEGATPVVSAPPVTPVPSVGSATSVTSVTAGQVVRVVRSVGAEVPRPVGDLAGTVTRDLDEARAKAPSLPALPTVPAPPKPPAQPSLPSLPSPVVDPPVPQQPGGLEVSSPGTASGGHEGAKTRAVPRVGVRTGHRATVTASFGPRITTGVGVPFTRVPVDGHRAVDRAGTPSRPAPGGDPGGVLANRAAVDSGTPRHADAHAVTPDHLAPPRLTPGVTSRVDASGTRDRYRDVPVFPG
ncbi:hypothetical protein [Streptomyces sp. NPDC001843]|uniref:hypothetical protein n=1 Tax=Streptomyces sp. NPDC001843 TaxID=3364617 RepID=UPI0036B21BCE